MNNSIKIEEISANGLTFTCRTCGLENNGDLVILLHGFPESSFMWEKILPVLAQKGYRCVAPNQRGYSKKARLKEEHLYDMQYLASDVVQIAAALQEEKFHIVGHDWGSTVCWGVLAAHPKHILSSTNMSTYYPAEYEEIMRTHLKQRAMSQYIFDFLDAEAQDKLFANGSAGIREYWAELPEESINAHMEVFGEKEGIEAAINWYRAKYRWLVEPEKASPSPVVHGDIYTPVMLIRGLEDQYQGPEGYARTHKYMKGYYNFIQLHADHWLMEHNTDFCIRAIVNHLNLFTVKNK